MIRIKQLLIYLACFVLFLSPQTLAMACGMLIAFDPYKNRVDYIMEDKHQVYINYEDGVEKLLVAIEANNLQGRQVAWLFPIPSEPTKISLDVLTTLPEFAGEDVSINAKSSLNKIKSALFGTQIYPAIANSMFGMSTNLTAPKNLPGLRTIPGGGQYAEPDVIIHSQIEKEGITSQVITARTADALFTYLKEKGMAINKGTIPVLNNYIGKDFSFIVSWITPSSQLETTNAQKGFFVSFPTKKIYYPLMPEQVYGDMVMPLSIRVVGHITPEVYPAIKRYTTVAYFVDKYALDNTQEALTFFGTSRERLEYTKIDLSAPSNLFTEDLWMQARSPMKIQLATFVIDHMVITTLLLLMYISVIASIAAGLLIFANKRHVHGASTFGLVGLANCFSILGFIIATLFIKTTEEKRADARKLAYIPVFSLTFLMIVWIVMRLISF